MENSDRSIILKKSASLRSRLAHSSVRFIFFLTAATSIFAVLAIIYFIARDAFPFLKSEHIKSFFLSTAWYPAANPPKFGALAILYGSMIVTLGAVIVSVPIGIFAAITLSDFLPFKIRQIAKPIIETLAAIPSVAYGFFALVIFAPFLQNSGGKVLLLMLWITSLPLILIGSILIVNYMTGKSDRQEKKFNYLLFALIFVPLLLLLIYFSQNIARIKITSGTNALNVAIILGIMAIPTITSLSEDALQAAGKELREASLALGATRSETLFKVVIPAARSGIIAAVILGMMRALGETMVVWMASGNAAQIPKPLFNFLQPVRTLTATIAGDMGEADQMTGSMRFHVLFAMAFFLLIISFISNLIIELIFKKRIVKE